MKPSCISPLWTFHNLLSVMTQMQHKILSNLNLLSCFNLAFFSLDSSSKNSYRIRIKVRCIKTVINCINWTDLFHKNSMTTTFRYLPTHSCTRAPVWPVQPVHMHHPFFCPAPNFRAERPCLGVFWGSGCPIYPKCPHLAPFYHFLVLMGALVLMYLALYQCQQICT